jgi:hypothetical protein
VIVQWASALEQSALGAWMRESALAYPLVNVVHLFGLTLLIGPMLLLDLRLLGFARQFALTAVSPILTRCAVAGIVMLIVTGVALFSADAGPLLRNGIFLTKLALIVLALANALAFRALWQSHLSRWDERPPVLGRIQAALSLVVWLAIGTLGRWIAYT